MGPQRYQLVSRASKENKEKEMHEEIEDPINRGLMSHVVQNYGRFNSYRINETITKLHMYVSHDRDEVVIKEGSYEIFRFHQELKKAADQYLLVWSGIMQEEGDFRVSHNVNKDRFDEMVQYLAKTYQSIDFYVCDAMSEYGKVLYKAKSIEKVPMNS